ncbi:hypothetical protein KA111_02220 [Candidatus Woesebacteria bacterium]|nr:hypothetical protein [Candidatus Woesebacteria bacterium]
MIEQHNGIPDKTDFTPITLPDDVDYKKLSLAHDEDLNWLKETVKTSEDELYTPEQAEEDNLRFFQDTAKNPTSRGLLERLYNSLKPQRTPGHSERAYDPKQKNLSFDQLTDSTFGKKGFGGEATIPDLDIKKQDIIKNTESNLEKMDREDAQTQRLLDVLGLAEDQGDINKVIEEAKAQYTNGKIRKENLDQIIEITDRKTAEIQEVVVREFFKELYRAENIVALGMILDRARIKLGTKRIDAKSFYIIIEKVYKDEKRKKQDFNVQTLMTEINLARTIKDLKAAEERAMKYADDGLIDRVKDLEKNILNVIFEAKKKIQEDNAKHILEMIKLSRFSDALLHIIDDIQLNATNDEINMHKDAPMLYEEFNKKMKELKGRERQDARQRAIEDAVEVQDIIRRNN